MQPATVDQLASEATLLSQEQLQSLTQAATVLGRELEEIASDVINYIWQLQSLTPAACAAATQDAVQQWMDRAAGAEAVAAELPATPSGRSSWTERWQCLPRNRQLCKW
jgi:hypothetical protein